MLLAPQRSRHGMTPGTDHRTVSRIEITPAMIAAGVKVLGDEGYAVVSEYVARELAEVVFREMMAARDKSSDDSLGLEKTS
jgi:hypothetical protein